MCNGKQVQKWSRLVCLNEVFAAAAAFCQREYGTADDMQAKQQCSHATATRTVQSYRWELQPLMLAFYWDTRAIVIASWSGPAISTFTHTLMNCSLFVKVFLIFFMCSMAKKTRKICFCYPTNKGLMASGFESDCWCLQPSEHLLVLVWPVFYTKVNTCLSRG